MSAASPARAPKIDRGKPLTKADYKALEARWITPDYAELARIRRVDDQEGAAVLGRNDRGAYAGLLIPYFLPCAERPHTYRIRRDHPEMEKGKPKNKYLGPPGENRVYFPVGTDAAWLADTSLPIVITEGEFKAIAACELARHHLGDTAERPRFLPIAIGGVWNWRGKTGISVDETGTRVPDKGVIADLGLLKWKGRHVTIVFDSDVDTNSKVRAARFGLSEHLWKSGARVKWVTWPKQLPAGVKGIDDYAHATGPEAALELITHAKPARDTVDVWTFKQLREANFPPPVPIVEDFLHQGETIGLVGKPKGGKSRLSEQLALALVCGEPWLGHAITKQHRVLLLDLENRPWPARNRLLRMADCLDGSDRMLAMDGNLCLYIPNSLMANRLTLGEKNGPKLLERAVEDHSPDVLIIDNWRLFLDGDENDNQAVRRALKILSSLRTIRPNLAILIVHHIRKHQQGENQPKLRIDPSGWTEGASGSYAFIAHLDACFGLERETTREGELIVFGGVARNTGPRTLLLDENRETLAFSILTDEDQITRDLFTPVELALWTEIRNLTEPFSFTDVVARGDTKNKKAVSSMLRKATNMNLLLHPDQSYRRPGSPALRVM